jgi:hypothetical protein
MMWGAEDKNLLACAAPQQLALNQKALPREEERSMIALRYG